jgi:hypothetical protein
VAQSCAALCCNVVAAQDGDVICGMAAALRSAKMAGGALPSLILLFGLSKFEIYIHISIVL